jgi:hypothetical protein
MGVKNIFGGMGEMIYLCIMKTETRKRLAKIAKDHLKDKVFYYESDNMRCQYKIKSVIPDKSIYDYVSYDFTLNLEVISVERRTYVRDEFGLLRRGEDGLLVREFRKYSPDKKFAHDYNHRVRGHAKNPIIFKALGLREYDIKVDKVKWNC